MCRIARLFRDDSPLSIAMSETNNGISNLSASVVREAMGRVLSSEEFQDSERLQAILRYIVEETLAGRSERIKATTIALDVLGRDIDDGSEPSSIVRVSAARLRRKLSHYYASSGRQDPVCIEIPTGTYVPTFTQSADLVAAGQVADEPSPERKAATFDGSRPRWTRWLAMAFGIAVLAAVTWAFVPLQDPDPVSSAEPFVVVLPLVDAGGEKLDAKLATGYMEAVIAELTRLSGLSVMAPRSAMGVANEAVTFKDLRKDHGVSHVLEGTLASQSETVRVSAQLIDTGTEEAVWAERFEGNLNDWFELEDKLANRIAAALSVTLDPNDSRRVYLRHTSNREAMELLRHAIVSINPPNERGRIEAAHSLHQRIIDLDPSFAGGYAGMSQVHSYLVLFEHSEQPEEDLKSAIAYARKATELDEGFGMGHSMLGLAYSLAGRTDLALGQVRRAVALEPGDPLSYQWLAGVLIFSGRYDEAVPPMQEALRLDPIEPGTPYLNILGMAYFGGGEYEFAIDAFERNRQRGGPDAPNMEAYRAATFAALGRDREAREVIANLTVRPGEISPESWIRRWTPSHEIAERAIEALHRLGMTDRIGALPGESASADGAGTPE